MIAPNRRRLLRDIEQRAALSRIFVEICEGLAILTLREQRPPRILRWLEAGQSAVDIAQPVAALGELAFVDDIDAGIPLRRYHGADVVRIRLAFGGGDLAASGQAADMSGKDFCRLRCMRVSP